jgi:predicted nucleotidyltransferase
MENEQGWTPPSDAEVVETKNWTPPSDAIADEPVKKKVYGAFVPTPLNPTREVSTSQSGSGGLGSLGEIGNLGQNKVVETPKEAPKPSINKKKFDEYNRTYSEYRSANEKYTSKRDEVFEINSPTITSTEGLIRSFTEPNRTIESVLNQQLSLENDLKKRKSSFYNATKDLSSEIDTQLDLLAKENGGWDKFVKPLGIADVDKVRDAVDGFLEKNNIPTDSPVAYKLRNQMKAKAEFKKIEPEIDVKFETEYRKKYGLSPDEDIQKEYGLKAGEVEGIKQAKLELEKKRAVENEALKKEFTPELKAIGDNYTLKTKELNSQIENDQEIDSYANSLMKQEFDKYQNLVNQGKMTVEQANAEMQSAEKTKETKAKVVEMVNKKYSKAFEGEFNAYQKQLNEVNSRYNSVYRRQEAARLEQANKKIGEEINKFKGTYKPSKEILERRESLYKDAYDAVALRYGTARENVGRELGHLRQLQATFSGLGGGIKGYGQFFDNKFLYDVGESMEANNLIKIPESKEFSDWLDADKLIVGSSNIIGRMFPMMGVSTVVGLTTENWGLAARMAAGSVTGWVTEGADMAGTVKGEVLEASGDPVEADKAANSMWRSHIYSMPLYTLSSIPYIGGLSTKIAKKIAPSLFKEAQVGARRTFGQYLKQTGVAAAVSGVAEVAEEVPQEFKQGIDEAAIRNGVEIKTIADQLKVLREGASRKGFKETVVQVVPSTLIMGSSPVFVSESAKQAKNKYYENKVDNYLNGLSINEALSTSPEQYIFNTLSEKGKNFTGTLINTLYTSGNINQQEYDALANKLVGMDNFQSWLKKNKAEGSATQNIVGYKLYGQYQEAKNELDASTEELGRGILEDKVKKAKEEFESYYKGEGTNAVILTMGDGKQFVFSPEEMNFALQFENIRAGIRDKNIAVSVYNKKGQEAIMEGTLNEMNILFQEKPLEETEVEVSDATNPATSQLQKFTSPTEDNYGTINRNDGKGIVTLTKEEYLNELQGKINTLESSIDAIDNEQSKAVVYEQVNELNKEKTEILKREIKPQDEIRNTDNNIRPQVESTQQEINIKPIEVIAGEEQDNADGGVAKVVQGDGQSVDAKKIEIEKRRQEELYNSLTKEDKEFVDNVRNKFGDEKANKQIKNKALNTSEGNKLLEKHKAEDTLDNIDSTIEERVAARYSLQGGHPFNVAQVSDITKSINNIKKGDSLSATEKEIKLIYDAELKAVGENVEVVTPKDNEALRDVESTAKALNKNPNALPSLRDAIANVDRDSVLIKGQRYTKEDIKYDILDKIGEDIDEIIDIRITGSRVYGTSKANSDLDVIVEYKGEVREDTLFDIANDDPIIIDGIKVDVNPVKAEKSGTIAENAIRERKYLDEVADEKYLSRAYHSAKADGTNPELVKAVESLLSKEQTPSGIKEQEVKVNTPDKVQEEVVETAETLKAQPTATPETKAAIDVYNRLKENNDTTTRKEYKALPESIKRVLDNIVNINKQLEQNKLITKKGNCP